MNDYPKVRRVEHFGDFGGTHIEPPLDENWNNLEKLRWHAAVTSLDTGLKILVHEMAYNTYCVQVENSSTAAQLYSNAWFYISGVGAGGKQAQLEGMIWYLADRLDHELPHSGEGTLEDLVEDAKKYYKLGLQIKGKHDGRIE